MALPQFIVASAAEIPSAYDLLADEESRREFLTQIRWRCLLDYACLPEPDPAGEMYFPEDLIGLSSEEVLADCGAFDGDSIRLFLNKTGGDFRRIYAFQPDAANLRALEKNVAALRERVEILPFALGQSDGTVQFRAMGSVGSKVGEGDCVVERRGLDERLARLRSSNVHQDGY